MLVAIDIHCHHFTFRKGGYIHPRFQKSRRVRFYLAGIGLIKWKDALRGDLPPPEELDLRYRRHLVTQADASPLDHVVALAFDGIYDERGRLDKEQTTKYVANEAVLDLMQESSKFLLGASINPLRRDWKDELDKCLEAGAVLIKWLPSVMGFDPADPRCLPFYERLRETGTPILMHVGFELALPTVSSRFARIDRLEAVLKTGVTVIAAHCCGGLPIPLIDNPWQFARMRRLVETYPNLYLDIAGMVAPHRKPRLLNSIHDPVVRERIVYATDFPITLQTHVFWRETRGISLPQNYFAKDMAIKEACGLDAAALERGYEPIRGRLAAAGVTHAPATHSCSCNH